LKLPAGLCRARGQLCARWHQPAVENPTARTPHTLPIFAKAVVLTQQLSPPCYAGYRLYSENCSEFRTTRVREDSEDCILLQFHPGQLHKEHNGHQHFPLTHTYSLVLIRKRYASMCLPLSVCKNTDSESNFTPIECRKRSHGFGTSFKFSACRSRIYTCPHSTYVLGLCMLIHRYSLCILCHVAVIPKQY